MRAPWDVITLPRPQGGLGFVNRVRAITITIAAFWEVWTSWGKQRGRETEGGAVFLYWTQPAIQAVKRMK